ncbi:MAG: ribosome maturation factor RimM [Syntrophobacterales bacterium]|nr:ribosome maturation factor RimM [Syntrophobacterales bacterium]
MDTKRWVPIGKIVRAHGVHGGLKILPYGESFAFKTRGDLLFVKGEGEVLDKLTVKRIQRAGSYWIVNTEEIRRRDEAEKLVGFELFLPEELLPPREEGEFFYYQLIGLEVRTRGGERVGVLEAIFETPAHDVYVVRSGDSEILVPAVEEIVLEVNVENRYMIIELLDGLRENDY